MNHNSKSIAILPLLAVLAACATPIPLTERDVEYRDRYISFQRACEARGGTVVVRWEPGMRPMQGPDDIPETGARYWCQR